MNFTGKDKTYILLAQQILNFEKELMHENIWSLNIPNEYSTP